MSTKLHLHFPYSDLPSFSVSTEREIVAGRAPTCDLDLTRYIEGYLQAISREHFKIFYRKGEGFLIVDISFNGTQVNDDDIVKGRPRILRDGDVIRLARSDDFAINVTIEDDPDITATVDDRELSHRRLEGETRPGLYFDSTMSQFVVNGHPIPHEHLTKLETTLLKFFLKNAGRLCTFDDIATEVWTDPSWAPGNNTISRAVTNLRKKLDQTSPGAGNYIRNIRGQGYIIIGGRLY